MLREARARWLALATAAAVVALAGLFAWLRNWPQPAPPAPPSAAAIDEAAPAAARAAFERLNCTMCHALAGHGNPASPLDGIGARRDAAAIREWTLGAGEARERLPAAVARMKERPAQDPDLPALIDYLAGLK